LVGSFVETLSTRIIGSFADRSAESVDAHIVWSAAGPSKADRPAKGEGIMAKKAKKAKKVKKAKKKK